MFLKSLGGRPGGLVYEVEVTVSHGTELPLRAGERAMFVLKRRHRLSVTDAAVVDAAGGCEWNTRCTQTATLFKQGDGWRRKDMVLKVQAVRGNPRLGQEEGQTVAKASLDFSTFCLPEPVGPKQLAVPLQPSGVLHVSVRTQFLPHYSRETDSLTDISYLSLPQSAMTSAATTQPPSTEDQDLSGFDPEGGGTIRAVWQQQAQPPAAQQQEPNPPMSRRKVVASVLRLPGRGTHSRSGSGSLKEQQQQRGGGAGPPLPHRSATAPCLAVGPGGAGAAQGAAGVRPGSSLTLQIPDSSAGGANEAATPTLFGYPAGDGGSRRVHREQQPPAATAQADTWTQIDLQEAVDQLYDSDEQPTPKPTVLNTVKRMLTGRARNLTPAAPGTTARQLHQIFGTPPPTAPKCTPNPTEVATIDRESSMSALRRRCKQLLAERDEARAEGYAEATLTVEQSLEIDKLRRAKDNLLKRLSETEQQLLACFRDEASTDLIRALAEARVEAAQQQYAVLELQRTLKLKDAVIDRLRQQLTKAEAKYRLAAEAAAAAGAAASPGRLQDGLSLAPAAAEIAS